MNAQHLLNQHIQTPIHKYHNKYSLLFLIHDMGMFMKGSIEGEKKKKTKKKNEKKKKPQRGNLEQTRDKIK